MKLESAEDWVLSVVSLGKVFGPARSLNAKQSIVLELMTSAFALSTLKETVLLVPFSPWFVAERSNGVGGQ